MTEKKTQSTRSNEAEAAEGHNKDSTVHGIHGTQLRNIIGGFVTGVTVITCTDTDGTPRGLTANAVTSLSLDPPLLLVAIDHKADTYPHLVEGDHFAVNILRADDNGKKLSNRFAGKGGEKFQDVSHQKGASGAPILDDRLAWLDCRTETTYEAGDHTIFIGRVVDGQRDDEADNPLVLYLGKYRELVPI